MSRRRSPSKVDPLAASEGARKAAAAILQVMAGLKSPAEASEALGMNVNRYYVLESRGLAAMLKALEPLPRGRRRRPEAELEALRRAVKKAEREASRYQALWRAGQKALGLSPPAARRADSKATAAGAKKARRPRVRAKALIAALSTPTPVAAAVEEPAAAGGTPT